MSGVLLNCNCGTCQPIRSVSKSASVSVVQGRDRQAKRYDNEGPPEFPQRPMPAFALLLTFVALSPAACPVTVVAQGVRGSQGTVGFVVFNSRTGWPEKSEAAFRSKGVPAKPGELTATFDMPAGRYSIAGSA